VILLLVGERRAQRPYSLGQFPDVAGPCIDERVELPALLRAQLDRTSRANRLEDSDQRIRRVALAETFEQGVARGPGQDDRVGVGLDDDTVQAFGHVRESTA
jgi:hypothetical protein